MSYEIFSDKNWHINFEIPNKHYQIAKASWKDDSGGLESYEIQDCFKPQPLLSVNDDYNFVQQQAYVQSSNQQCNLLDLTLQEQKFLDQKSQTQEFQKGPNFYLNSIFENEDKNQNDLIFNIEQQQDSNHNKLQQSMDQQSIDLEQDNQQLDNNKISFNGYFLDEIQNLHNNVQDNQQDNQQDNLQDNDNKMLNDDKQIKVQQNSQLNILNLYNKQDCNQIKRQDQEFKSQFDISNRDIFLYFNQILDKLDKLQTDVDLLKSKI